MSELRKSISAEFIKAMKEKRESEKNALSLIQSELKSKDIAARPNRTAIEDSEILDMLQKMIKQRHESLEIFKKAGRDDLAEKEESEIKVISKFLPKPLNEEETIEAIEKAIAFVGGNNIKNMGGVMSYLKENYSGKLDFSKVGLLVKSRLN